MLAAEVRRIFWSITRSEVTMCGTHQRIAIGAQPAARNRLATSLVTSPCRAAPATVE
jgi:hypothetical protein